MGNGSTFESNQDYFKMGDELLSTLCHHNMMELIAAMACANPELFMWALAQISPGCESDTLDIPDFLA